MDISDNKRHGGAASVGDVALMLESRQGDRPTFIADVMQQR
jgi:hypothetical protein